MARPKKEKEVKQESLETQLWKAADKLRKHLARTPGTIAFNYAVLEAYGWTDLDLRHDFYEVDYLPETDRTRFTLHPAARREVLKRLLALNHEIHTQEVADGLWEKKGTKDKAGKIIENTEMKKSAPVQYQLKM